MSTKEIQEQYETDRILIDIPAIKGDPNVYVKNNFTVTKNKESRYEFKYNTKNQTIQVIENPRLKGKTDIGIINLKDNSFIEQKGNVSENAYFSSKNGIKIAKRTVANHLLNGGLNEKEINSLLGTNFNLGGGTENIGVVAREVEKSKRLQRESYENLVYPTTLRRSNNDRLKITVLTPQVSETNESGEEIAPEPIGSVTLPVPGNFSDKNQVDFKSGTLNPLEKALAESGLEALLEGDTQKLQNNITRAIEGKDELRSITAGLFVGKSINKGANEILSRQAGAIINPNMQLLFSGPQLRPFDFNYKISPRDRGESIQVQKIIRMFKQAGAVQRTQTEFFLRSPNRFRLEFLTRGDSPHTFLPKIKTCALLGFGVNYTPEGSFMTYENSSMVSYQISFSFQEIEPVFNDEYGNVDDDIGF
tara:strand:+ start:259 stop:1518 length:1260 start_codon:yes stop_codon:yes gene_type:complete